MTRFVTILAAVALVAFSAGAALAQEEAHYEGYFINSAQPPVNPNPQTIGLAGRGLVTALYSPLVSNFTTNEYTWVIQNLLQTGNTVNGTTTYTSYNVSISSITIYEDPSQDARGTFYNCPSDINSPTDPRYQDGTVYLRGHFVSFSSTYDPSTQQGTFSGTLNWDSGSHINDLPLAGRGGWTFGGTTSSNYSCIPTASGYDQAMTGRIFQVTTPAKPNSWGQLKNLYR